MDSLLQNGLIAELNDHSDEERSVVDIDGDRKEHTTNLFLGLMIASLSILGALLRIELSGEPYPTMGTVFVPNALGCGLVGFLKTLPKFVDSFENNPFLVTIVTAIVTGFCGSLTSFSTVIQDDVAIALNSVQFTTDISLHIFITYATAMASMAIGSGAVEIMNSIYTTSLDVYLQQSPSPSTKCDPRSASLRSLKNTKISISTRGDASTTAVQSLDQTPIISDSNTPTVVTAIQNGRVAHRKFAVQSATTIAFLIFISLLSVCLGIALSMKITYQNKEPIYTHLLAASLAPIGAIARWQLSRLNKVRRPIGTFSANILAAILASTLTQVSFLTDVADLLIDPVAMLISGTIGSLSTMSTFIFEIKKMPSMMMSAAYLLATHLTSIIAALLITYILRIAFGE